MNKLFILIFSTIVCLTTQTEAIIQVNKFVNESDYSFQTSDQSLVVESNASFETETGDYKIILEDAGHSGYHRPHWKFNVWLQSAHKLPFFKQNAILYAVIFYDGLGEIDLHLNKDGELNIIPANHVKKIIYPWAVATIGRGNPYHNIQNREIDRNDIIYFDHYGFVGYPQDAVLDDQCESFDNYKKAQEINAPMNK